MPKVYKSTVIQTTDISEVIEKDRITLRHNESIISGIRVKERRRKLYIESGFLMVSRSKLYLSELNQYGYTLESIARDVETEVDGYVPGDDELDPTRPGVKPGSRASLENALEAAEAVIQYFQRRIDVGDPLFDQWMVDAFDGAKKSSESLKKTMEALYR